MSENLLLDDPTIRPSYKKDDGLDDPTILIRDARKEDDCLLCEYTQGDRYFRDVLKLDINVDNNRIFESEHFVFMHDIHPIIPGHCLLMSKAHFRAFALVPLAYDLEFKRMLQMSIAFIREQFGTPIIFEHGSMSDEPGSGVCINHAHLHLIPTKADLTDEIQHYSASPLKNQKTDILPALRDVKDHYLFYQNTDGHSFVIREPKLPIPQQFIRRVIANQHPSRAWDWKQALYLEA